MPRKKSQPDECNKPVYEVPKWLRDDSDTLKEMVCWWKTRESNILETSSRRPVFTGKTRNTGIRVSEVILERAIEKAKQERLKTGGNLSQLIEWLLWMYIGSPDDVVEHPPE